MGQSARRHVQQGSASLWGWLGLLLLALVVVLPSCGDDPEPAPVPTPTTVPTETPTPVPTSTLEPLAINQVLEGRELAHPTPTLSPTSTPESAPPTAVPSPTATSPATPLPPATPSPGPPTPEPTSTPEVVTPAATSTTVDVPRQADSADCPPGSGLVDGPTVSRCNIQALESISSLSFAARMSLAAMLPVAPDDAEVPALEMSGALIPPDRFRYNLSVGDGDEVLNIAIIAIGDDLFTQDPLTESWYKDASGMFDATHLTEQIDPAQMPDDADVALDGIEDHDDGRRSYALTSVSPIPLGDLGGLGGEAAQLRPSSLAWGIVVTNRFGN